MQHEDGFEEEARFHHALGYLCEQYNGFQSKHLKQLMNILNPSILKGLFERREYKRMLRYIGESNEHFTHGKIYSSLTFNGATYEILNENGVLSTLGYTYFEDVNIQ